MSTEQRLQQALHDLARDPKNRDTVARVQTLSTRLGINLRDQWIADYESAQAAVETARAAVRRMDKKREHYRSLLYRKLYGSAADWICSQCKESGWVRHFDTEYPCSHQVREGDRDRRDFTYFRPDEAKWKLADRAANKIYDPLTEPLHDAHRLAADALNRYQAALEGIGKGARLCYSNSRARAKFKTAKGGLPAPRAAERVPVGTVGVVFWVRAEAGSTAYGLRCEDGATFFTTSTNCDPIPMDVWERHHGVDQGVLQVEAVVNKKDLAVRADAPVIRDVFGAAGPSRGDWARLGDTIGRVFWVGPDKRTGRARVGLKFAMTSRDEEPTWGLAADCEAVSEDEIKAEKTRRRGAKKAGVTA